MSKFQFTLDVGLPLYDALKSESSFGKKSDSKIEKTEDGVRITVSTDDITALLASTNYWLRLIKASSSVYQVI
jgi:tRNA threonylcarbamoyladenosine modification (KEOPS) complex  Pcc1 subunit